MHPNDEVMPLQYSGYWSMMHRFETSWQVKLSDLEVNLIPSTASAFMCFSKFYQRAFTLSEWEEIHNALREYQSNYMFAAESRHRCEAVWHFPIFFFPFSFRSFVLSLFFVFYAGVSVVLYSTASGLLLMSCNSSPCWIQGTPKHFFSPRMVVVGWQGFYLMTQKYAERAMWNRLFENYRNTNLQFFGEL